MNTDNDYDNDGNNIVPCPICLDQYCPSKEDGKCPEEDEFVEAMNQSQPEKAERGIEEIMRECDVLFDGIELAKSWFRKQITGIHQSHHQELQKARTAEQERVVGIVEGKFDEPHEGTDDVTKEQSDYWVDGYNQALTDITNAIRGNEGK